jgi:hypothetical protein
VTGAEALKALHEMGRIRSPWQPGMLVRGGGYLPHSLTGSHWGEVTERLLAPMTPYLDNPRPDLTDPATVGCLAALLREASGDRCASASPVEFFQSREYTGRWFARWAHPIEGFEDGPEGATEGEALINALIALAGGEP